MDKRIVGFHQDEQQHWVAELECGHNQHVRHDPPWTNRGWVTSPQGRASHLGNLLNCVKCDNAQPPDCSDRVRAVLAALDIPLESIAARALEFHPEATELLVAETGEDGKEYLLVPRAAGAWRAMKLAASADGIVIRVVSA